ncbi:MAG: GTP pyrophosphokinase family protein [Lachnospiraceae bacterium]|jgi:putative GTP pyrophosphokinase|nr:GTP pyrophosphokinase family protein [Lachnospiraceae bacterium]
MELQLWRQILQPYALAVDELIVKMNHMKNEFEYAGEYSPIESVHGRVKKISSILEKAQRKQIELDDVENQLDDIAGVRIICRFVEDIDKVVELIRQRSDMTIVQEKDYIRGPKKSGYRSYHLIVKYTVQSLEGPKELNVEIQVRTLAMNFWATVEHSLQYKYKGNMPAHVKDKLLSSAEAIVTLDDEMSVVRKEILDAQNYYQHKTMVVSNILSNIENLYKVANKKEVLKIQDEFIAVYKEDNIKKIEHFGKELDIVAESYRAQRIV